MHCQFALADAAVAPNFDPVGVALISLSLVADAFVGNAQEALLAHGATLAETVAWTNLFSSAICATTLFVVDDWAAAIAYATMAIVLVLERCTPPRHSGIATQRLMQSKPHMPLTHDQLLQN